MAGQDKPKLYARQKAKHLTLILLASLLLSVYVQAEVVLYCQTELATGLIQDKQTGQWKTGPFELKRYTIKFNDDYGQVTGLWRDEEFPCAPAYPSIFPHRIVCSKPNGHTFIYDKLTRRFLNSTASVTSYIGDVLNGDADVINTDTTVIYAGTCQKF